MFDRAGWVLAVVGLLAIGGVQAAEIVEPVSRQGSEARMKRDITILASDEYEGRGVTTRGINKAAHFVAEQFQKAGLKPGGKDGSYFQPFTMPGATLAGPAKLELTGPQGQVIDLKQGSQFEPLGMSHSGDVTAPVVFVGYGITFADKAFSYDDYKDVDVEGKIVIILRDTPNAANKFIPFAGPQRRDQASFTRKFANAVKHKAAGILFVNDHDVAEGGDDLLDFGFIAMAPNASKLPAAHVQRSVIDSLLKSSIDKRLNAIEKDIDRDLKPQSASLAGWSVHLTVNVKRDGIPLKNVIGVIEGKGPLADETVVIGAHYDHLGYGGFASLAGLRKQAIHHGADDNGSGTTTVIELARRFGAMKEREGRRLVFMTFSGEESGLLGSQAYVAKPIFPLDKTTTMVNLDMVGRLRFEKDRNWQKVLTMLTPAPRFGLPVPTLAQTFQGITAYDVVPGDRLMVYGTGTAKTFDTLIEEVNQKHQFRLRKIASGVAPSDNTSFVQKKIPVFFFFTGDHSDYHRPSDTADKINVTGMARVADLVQDLVGRLASEKRPEYVAVKGSEGGNRPGGIPKLGIRPGDYSEEFPGVPVAGVSSNGPAEKAGIKEGDRIVSIGGKPVRDIRVYMSLLGAHKAGTPIDIGIIRNGKEMKVKAVPE